MLYSLIISNRLKMNIISYKTYFFLISSFNKYNAMIKISNFFFFNKFNIIFFFSKNYLNLNSLNFFFISWTNYFVRKIKFRHKVVWFKISRKYLQTIRFNLGLCHFNYFFTSVVRFKRKKKYLTYNNFLFWSVNYLHLKTVMTFIKNLLPINCYTQKGFRFARDIFEKRGGKMSKYAHLKSKLF